MPDPETPVSPAADDPKPKDDPKPETPAAKPDPPDEPFDKDRALETIRKQREAEAEAKERAKKAEAELQKIRDKDKTESEKLSDRASSAEKERDNARADAARLRVALKKGLTESQAKRLVGETEEELEKDADELLASFKDAGGGEKPSRRPTERLRPGAAPDAGEGEPTDPRKLAEAVSRSSFG